MSSSNIRCSECKKNIVEIVKLQDWFFLHNLVEILFLQEDITLETRNTAMDALQTFHEFAYQEEINHEDIKTEEG